MRFIWLSPSLPAEYQKILILADLTTGFREIDMEKSRLCLHEGLDILRFVEPDRNTLVRRQLVSRIVLVRAPCFLKKSGWILF